MREAGDRLQQLEALVLEAHARDDRTTLIALYADIHGNREALTACLDDAAEQGADAHVFLGLIADDGIAGSVLRDAGTVLRDARETLARACA